MQALAKMSTPSLPLKKANRKPECGCDVITEMTLSHGACNSSSVLRVDLLGLCNPGVTLSLNSDTKRPPSSHERRDLELEKNLEHESTPPSAGRVSRSVLRRRIHAAVERRARLSLSADGQLASFIQQTL